MVILVEFKKMGKQLGSRGRKALLPSLTYFPLFQQALDNLYHHETNPDGHICLSVAENKLPFDEFLAEKISDSHTAFEKEDLGDKFVPFYGDMRGRLEFRKTLANFASKYFTNGRIKLDPENFIVGTGCGSLLDILAWTLAERGDYFIIPAPFYPAFNNDLGQRSEVKIAKCYLKNSKKITIENLEKAWEESEGRAKALLLTNPHNPLGICFSKDEIKLCLDFCREKGIFLIVDEIYALSVHSKQDGDEEFVSILDVATEMSENGKLGDDVVLIHGFSKDFCLSGSRVGYFYSENEDLISACCELSYFFGVSSVTQNVLTNLLKDGQWLDTFFEASRQMLSAQCARVKEALSSLGIPFLDPTSAMFIIGDFRDEIRRKLEIPAERKLEWKDERAFFELIAAEEKVLFTPGQDCYFSEPGYFRLCYGFIPIQGPEELKKRLTRFLRN